MVNCNIAKVNPVKACFSQMKTNYYRHEIFEILWFKENTRNVCHKIDHQKYPIPKNGIFLLGIGQTHELREDLNGYSIYLPRNFFQQGDHSNMRIMFNPFVNDPMEPDEASSIHLERILSMIVLEAQTTNYQPVIHAYLAAFLHKLSLIRKDLHIVQEDRSQRLSTLFELIEKHRLTERKTSFYAERIGLTTKRLNEILKIKVGLTLTQLLHKILIADAKKMIAKGDRSIKEVSYDLGFSEQAYFSRFFKKQTGMTPLDFSRITQND